jgi:nicotinate-nucleotide adenylyltransferase
MNHNQGLSIGLFGGTFDPVHTGHLIIAELIRQEKNLDSIIFIPSARPPHKGAEIMFSPEERMEMLSLATKSNPRFHISDIELARRGLSYTIDTIYQMKDALPAGTELYFILGQDNLYEIETWKNPQEIINICKILIAPRQCGREKKIPEWLRGSVEMVAVPLIEISSTEIRRRLKIGLSIQYLVPDPVFEYLQKNRHGRKEKDIISH